MKLIIDIPKVVKHKVYAYGLSLSPSDKEQLIKAIMNGIPLDNLRAEIDGIEINGQIDEHTLFIRGAEEVKKMALNIIDKYRNEVSE